MGKGRKAKQRMKQIIFCILLAVGFCGATAQVETKTADEENKIDSTWRTSSPWRINSVDLLPRNASVDTVGMEKPWWPLSLDEYFSRQMVFPAKLLRKNHRDYAIIMFQLDTLGNVCGEPTFLYRPKENAFRHETLRLIKELPHGQPCRTKEGKRLRCFYTAYIQFLPQRYRERQRHDSIEREESKHIFSEPYINSRLGDSGRLAAKQNIEQHLDYDTALLGGKEQVKGIYRFTVDSYGEVGNVRILRSCGVQQYDSEAVRAINSMPRWRPKICLTGKGMFYDETWAVPIVFKKSDNEQTNTIGKQETHYIDTIGRHLPSDLSVKVMRKGRLVQTINYKYDWTEDLPNGDVSGDIILKDVNFDGEKDLLISLGSYGIQGVEYFDCYVWDNSISQFVHAPTFKDIQNPTIASGCIFSKARESAATYIYERWTYDKGRFAVTARLVQRFSTDRTCLYDEYLSKRKRPGISFEDISELWKCVVQQ